MSLETLAIALSSFGGACELTGLALVVREVAADRKRGRRLLARLEASKPPKRTYAQRVPAPEPTLMTYAQLAGVMDEVRRVEARLANDLVELKKATDDELDQAMRRIHDDVAVRDHELRDGLRYVLAGSTRSRLAGVALLAAGIALAVSGSVVGAVA